MRVCAGFMVPAGQGKHALHRVIPCVYGLHVGLCTLYCEALCTRSLSRVLTKPRIEWVARAQSSGTSPNVRLRWPCVLRLSLGVHNAHSACTEIVLRASRTHLSRGYIRVSVFVRVTADSSLPAASPTPSPLFSAACAAAAPGAVGYRGLMIARSFKKSSNASSASSAAPVAAAGCGACCAACGFFTGDLGPVLCLVGEDRAVWFVLGMASQAGTGWPSAVAAAAAVTAAAAAADFSLRAAMAAVCALTNGDSSPSAETFASPLLPAALSAAPTAASALCLRGWPADLLV